MIVNVNLWLIVGGFGVMYFVGDFDGCMFMFDCVVLVGFDFV